MSRKPPHRLTASEATRRIRLGGLKVPDLVEACLEQIQRQEPIVKAWVHLAPQSARETAFSIQRSLQGGEDPGPLAGIPLGIKDIFNTHDMPTGMGSPLWKDYTPGNDARVVASLRLAGGIILGKTVTAEFAVHAPGPTTNPHHPEYTPGTSSSGSAAAVAACMVPLALGSQTAGSTIRPASYCGIYGFKPSFGLIPRTGSLKTTDSLDTVGILARSSEDVQLCFDAVRVKGSNYPVVRALLENPSRQRPPDRPWRIVMVKGPRWQEAEGYAQEALSDFAERLAGLPGVRVQEEELPEEMAQAHAVHETIYDKALSYYFKEEFRREQLISPILKSMILHGQQIPLTEYRWALERQAELAQILDHWLKERADLLLTLSTGGEPPRGLATQDRLDTGLIWTLCGMPALSLPAFMGPNGLPFGAQIVARRYNDFQLLGFAESLARKGLVPEETHPCLESDDCAILLDR